jgi:hypothetical protein
LLNEWIRLQSVGTDETKGVPRSKLSEHAGDRGALSRRSLPVSSHFQLRDQPRFSYWRKALKKKWRGRAVSIFLALR